jgi:hypothetical protein
MRARMIELSWSGLRVPAIAVELDCSQKTVRCRLHRFNRLGLQGLDDLGGQGRKRRITEQERSRIISLVKTAPEISCASADNTVLSVRNLGQPVHGVATEGLVDRNEIGAAGVVQRRDVDADLWNTVVDRRDSTAAVGTEAPLGLSFECLEPGWLSSLAGPGDTVRSEPGPPHQRRAAEFLAMWTAAGVRVDGLAPDTEADPSAQTSASALLGCGDNVRGGVHQVISKARWAS